MVKWHKLLLITATLGLLAACEEEGSVDDAEDDPVTENTEEEAEEETEEELEEEPTTSLGKRSNPVPLGETAQIDVRIIDYDDEDFETQDGVLEVTLSNIISGDDAYEMLLEENSFVEEAPEGYQWLIFDVEATLVEGHEDVAYNPLPIISSVSASGAESPDGYYTTIDDEFGYIDLYHGGSASGRQSAIAPIDEEFLIKWHEGFGSEVFFDVE
ncbi:hypothetical protein ACO1PF_05030 [Alkalibacterium sp. f15]|uniref:hypothetical protein n=1 Tax=Alkalibacterium sp. f15 TaxID=3414029 RepID=UPI003BF85557